jgi:pyrroline-5-carboxylate reductase
MSVGFIGAGRMAFAMIRGFINQKMVAPQQIIASDIDGGSRETIRQLGASVTPCNKETATKSDILFLSVKPQVISSVLSEIKSVLSDRTLIISVAAGVEISTIQGVLGENVRVIRVMPNTPMLIGKGASGFARGPNVTDCDIRVAKGFLDSVGLSMETSESSLDAVTGVSGSGPSYALTLMEAMADGGVKMGLSRQVALTLAAQTVAGAAEMFLATRQHPALMRDEIVSPAGTTAHANHALEKGGFRNTVINAVEAATLRSIELSRVAASASSTAQSKEVENEKQKTIEKLSEDLLDKFQSLKKSEG